MNQNLFIAIVTLALIGLASSPLWLPRRENGVKGGVFNLANIAVGIHDCTTTLLADAAISTRYLLVKHGSDAQHGEVCGANDRPIGICTDEPTAAEDAFAVNLFGAQCETQRVVANGAIAAGVDVYTAAGGKVGVEPTTAGTYFRVGRTLFAAGADGDVIEIDPIEPERLVVIAALGNTNGEIGGLTFSGGGPTQAECNALRDKCEELADDVRTLVAALASAKVVTIAS